MSDGKNEKPCGTYRPWKGQEPLCGNCAWIFQDHHQHQWSTEEVRKCEGCGFSRGGDLLFPPAKPTEVWVEEFKRLCHTPTFEGGFEGSYDLHNEDASVAFIRQQISLAEARGYERGYEAGYKAFEIVSDSHNADTLSEDLMVLFRQTLQTEIARAEARGRKEEQKCFVNAMMFVKHLQCRCPQCGEESKTRMTIEKSFEINALWGRCPKCVSKDNNTTSALTNSEK